MKRPCDDNEEGNSKSSKDGKIPTTTTPTTEPITSDGIMPNKKFYRSRAHCNPLSHNNFIEYPTTPDDMDWKNDHYPNIPYNTSDSSSSKYPLTPNILDIGCGYGGLTLALSKLFLNDLILGIEIRPKVSEYVRLRIAAHRQEHKSKNQPDDGADDNDNKNSLSYENCSVLKSNFMKFLVNLFPKSSIDKMFFCFPDPHFKKKNHPRRIISSKLLSEYAYLLKPGIGRLYCITDVEDLHNWHVEKCDGHPMFVRIEDEDELAKDVCVDAMKNETEESKKVDRAGSGKYYCVYQRVSDDDIPVVNDAESFWDDGQFGVVSDNNHE